MYVEILLSLVIVGWEDDDVLFSGCKRTLAHDARTQTVVLL